METRATRTAPDRRVFIDSATGPECDKGELKSSLLTQIMARGNITSRWSGEIHPNGEAALFDPAWAQAISIGKVQLNNKISKMEGSARMANPLRRCERAIEDAGHGRGGSRAKLPSV